MIYIAHRGNLNGPNLEQENHPDYIKLALKQGHQAEVDVWYVNNKYYLGHDSPQYEVDRIFLTNPKIWCHVKNIETITELSSRGNLIHYFFNDTDDCALTSRGWIWTYSGKPVLSKKAIAVMPERADDWDLKNAGGICTDYINNYK